MDHDGQAHIAAVLGGCTQWIEDRLAEEAGEFDADDGILRPADHDQLSLRVIAKRMRDIEFELLLDLQRRERRSARTRLRHWTAPRLGVLRHHPPRPLTVPTHYLRTQPPRPAPTISIVTPSYQQGRYLERTIHSVLSQSYPALQYVVQDGGSDDETADVLARHRAALAHAASEPDGGQGDAINRGFAHTDGEIMAYLNSDDLLLPGSLAYVARHFDEHPEVDVVYGQRLMIDEHDRQIGRWVLPPHDDRTLTMKDYVPQETLFWRRPAWERAGGQIDASMRFAIDWDLLLRLRDSGARMRRLPRYLGAFRVHEDQKTAREHEALLAESDALRRRALGRAMSEEEADVQVQPFLRRHVGYHTAYALAERLPLPRREVRTVPLLDAMKALDVSAFDRR